ncbi:hypothetical protein Hanom_Chr09g00852611 [Helianthus anomalus]
MYKSVYFFCLSKGIFVTYFRTYTSFGFGNLAFLYMTMTYIWKSKTGTTCAHCMFLSSS